MSNALKEIYCFKCDQQFEVSEHTYIFINLQKHVLLVWYKHRNINITFNNFKEKMFVLPRNSLHSASFGDTCTSFHD